MVRAQRQGINPQGDRPPPQHPTRSWLSRGIPDSGRVATADVVAILQRIAVLCRLPASRMQHVLLLQCCDALDASGRLGAADVGKLRVLLRKLRTMLTVLSAGWTQVGLTNRHACILPAVAPYPCCCQVFSVPAVVLPHPDLLPAMLQDTLERRPEGLGDVPALLKGWTNAGLQQAAVLDAYGVHTGGGAVTVCTCIASTMLLFGLCER